MDISYLIQAQYHAALAMLEQSVEQCPDSLWDDSQDRNRSWRVAFHVLYYTHLYLSPTEEEYVPWSKHRDEAQHFERIFVGEPYTRAEILEYLNFCREYVAQQLSQIDYEAPSGFSWIPLNKFELQLYNIRHIQHHTGELYERLGARAEGVEVDWVGSWPEKVVP